MLAVRTGMNTARPGPEMASAVQIQITCSSTAKNLVISADIIV